MADITNKSVVVTITRDEARVWATGMERRMNPTKIFVHLFAHKYSQILFRF